MSGATHPAASRERAVRTALLRATGVLFAVATVFYNEWLLGLASPDGELLAPTAARVRAVQLTFAVLAAIFLVSAAAVARRGATGGGRLRPATTKLLLAGIAALVPLATAELVLRPFWASRSQRQTTTIFMRDADLGWRLRPGADDVWDGVRVRVNSKGLRGPELAYQKPPSAFRIAWLGDSVTFGHGLAADEETFPYVVERELARHGIDDVETLNAGVGGWSPWQERRWLESEGVRYSPDLVVVSFVLNDAVEPFELARFGGSGEGFHLARTASRWRLEERSALFWAVRLLVAWARWGADLKSGAVRHETLGVRALVARANSPAVRDAWRVTLAELDALVRWCRKRAIAVTLVAFPFTFQLQDPEGTSAPQRVLAAFAHERGVPFLDLLPLLARRMAGEELAAEDLFLDADHPSARGNAIIAEMIADFLIRTGTLAR